MTDHEQERKQNDAAFISSIARWPRWPLLPLVRVRADGVREEGFILANAGLTTTVNMGSMFDSARTNEAAAGIGVRQVYANAAAIVAAGWRVD